jgi:hypothetical protein
MIKHFVAFKLWLFFVLALSFAAHYFLLKNLMTPDFLNSFKISYLGNFIITSVVFFFLLWLKERQAKNLGFVFLFTSMLKFLFFYLALHPTFMLDNQITKPEFFSFFVPYTLSLVLEVSSLVKVLNQS